MPETTQPPVDAASQFHELARIYDDLMRGISYDLWLVYIRNLWRSRKHQPSSVLDIACGTGNVSYLLAQEGLRVVGVDVSAPMIDRANAKLTRAQSEDGNPRFYCCDAAALELQEQFDSAVSLFDSLNYILDYDRLVAAFGSAYRHLVPGGLFVFDVNTIYALSHGFFDQQNLAPAPYPRYQWRSRWDDATRLCTIEMDFEHLGETCVHTFHETHLQRGYTRDELEKGLLSVGFRDIQVFQAYTMRKPGRTADRLYLISRRP